MKHKSYATLFKERFKITRPIPCDMQTILRGKGAQDITIVLEECTVYVAFKLFFYSSVDTNNHKREIMKMVSSALMKTAWIGDEMVPMYSRGILCRAIQIVGKAIAKTQHGKQHRESAPSKYDIYGDENWREQL